MDKLKIVKIVVALLTFLLIFGTLLLMTVIYQKTRRPSAPAAAELTLGQPEGSTIGDFKTDDRNIYFLLKNGGLSDRLLIYDRSSGTVSATIQLN